MAAGAGAARDRKPIENDPSAPHNSWKKKRASPKANPMRGDQGGQASTETRTVVLVGSDDRHWLDIMPAAAGHESFVVDGAIESSEAHIVAAVRSDHDQRFSPWRT